MDVYIADFGRGNYAWERCKANPSIATMNDEDAQHFWLAGDREGFIVHIVRTRKTASGNSPPRATASRWYNLMTIIFDSNNDFWIHRSENEIWCTKTTNMPAALDEAPREISYQKLKVFECHKPCLAWSNTNSNGARLDWGTLHPKARDFLATESTFQKLSEDYANYAIALVNGNDLSEWRGRSAWKEILAVSKRPQARSFDRFEKADYQMAETAWTTTENADGRIIEKKVKVKNFEFPTKDASYKHILELLHDQENMCAITGLPFQFIDCCDDRQMLPSLDRIDSDGHYAAGNLQIVCRFINFWKSNQDNDEFRRLIRIVQSTA